MNTKIYKIAELIIVFIGIPILYYLDFIPGHKSLPLLIVFIFCLIWLLKNKDFNRKKLGFNSFLNYKFLIIRLILASFVILIMTYYIIPEYLFYLPQKMVRLWLLIMFFYPIWSAFPQELIYRTFFFERYKDLFQNKWLMITVNSLLFGFLHFIFGNWIAVVGASIIGFVFSYTYSQHHSLMVVSIEHAIIGDLVFTIGLGAYFYVPDF